MPPMSGPERDRMIIELRRRRWTIRKIAKYVGMSPNGVHAALERITEGRPGRDPRA